MLQPSIYYTRVEDRFPTAEAVAEFGVTAGTRYEVIRVHQDEYIPINSLNDDDRLSGKKLNEEDLERYLTTENRIADKVLDKYS